MKTNEYLWWVETIRQDSFRRTFPVSVAAWVSFAIGLICSLCFFYFKYLDPSIIAEIFSPMAFISAAIMFLLLWILTFFSTSEKNRIKAIKQVWEKSPEGTIIDNKKLQYFYAQDVKLE